MSCLSARAIIPEPQNAEEAGNLLRNALRDKVNTLRSGGDYVLHIPSTTGVYQVLPHHNFHSMPEFFFQLEGETLFHLPAEEFYLRPGECAIIPRGLPHMETVSRISGVFQNIVLSFHRGNLSYHFGLIGKNGRPQVNFPQTKTTRSALRMTTYLDDLVASVEGKLPLTEDGRRGLLLTVLSSWLRLVEMPMEAMPLESILVSRCKHLVHQRLQDPTLSVQSLSRELNCAADYLSHTFSATTNERLTHYINSRRIDLAQSLLRETAMNISEIAYAIGYRDPGYFTRIFRRLTGESPRGYRTHIGSDYFGLRE